MSLDATTPFDEQKKEVVEEVKEEQENKKEHGSQKKPRQILLSWYCDIFVSSRLARKCYITSLVKPN